MAATTAFYEMNGAANGGNGTTSGTAANVNWKNTDDIATAYTSSTITAGNNSYIKYQYLKFAGTFNQISNVKFAHTAGAMDSNVTLFGGTGIYTTPATTDIGFGDMSSVISASAGTGVHVGAGGPGATLGVSTTTNPAYTSYLLSQLQTTASTAAGDITQVTLTVQFDES